MVLSVVVPCYNEEDALPIFYKETCKIVNNMECDCEFVFINDGSKDRTIDIIRVLSLQDNRVKYISFSRNFGKEAAMYAGLSSAIGGVIVLMDADMQDPPTLLPQMYNIIQKGEYDSVATRRVDRRGEPPIRSFFARQFYKLMRRISSTEIMDGARDYRMMNRKFVDAVLSLSEYNRFSKGLFGWVGFSTYWLPYENTERVAGETKWSFWKLLVYAFEGIMAFSTTPLILSAGVGVLLSGFSFAAIMFIVIRHLLYGNEVTGWASTVSIVLFVAGIQLFFVGIIGAYLAKTYLEVKHRPLFICKETNI